MEPTIQRLPIKRPKITISAARFAVKLPVVTEADWDNRVVAFAKVVKEKLGPVTQTHRGNITTVEGKFQVTLRIGDRHEHVGQYLEGE